MQILTAVSLVIGVLAFVGLFLLSFIGTQWGGHSFGSMLLSTLPSTIPWMVLSVLVAVFNEQRVRRQRREQILSGNVQVATPYSTAPTTTPATKKGSVWFVVTLFSAMPAAWLLLRMAAFVIYNWPERASIAVGRFVSDSLSLAMPLLLVSGLSYLLYRRALRKSNQSPHFVDSEKRP